MEREVKIKLLRSLQSGDISLEDLKPKHFRLVIDTVKKSGETFINEKLVDNNTYMEQIKRTNDISIITGINHSIVTVIFDGKELKHA